MLSIPTMWIGEPVRRSSKRSEEHTSELQSRFPYTTLFRSYNLRFIFFKNGIDQFLIGNGTFNKSPCRFRMGVCHGLDLIESVFFYGYVVVRIHVVDSYDVDW